MLAYALKLTLCVTEVLVLRLLRANPSKVYWHIYCYLYTF